MVFGDGKQFDRLETALEAAGLAWWWMELPAGVVFFSQNKTRMLDREHENFFHYNDFVNLVHLDDKDRIMKDMTDHIEGHVDKYETTYRIMAGDGSYRQFYDKGRMISKTAEGEMVIAGIVFDITDIDFAKINKHIGKSKKSHADSCKKS